jgi:crossover junction endodeoxyribonuclease RusA
MTADMESTISSLENAQNASPGSGKTHSMLTFTLPFPPSVNTYYRRGQNATYLSKAGRLFKEKVADIISNNNIKLNGRLFIYIALSSNSKRLYDIDNRIKATLDALQSAGVFDDDEQVDRIEVVRQTPCKGGYCKVVIMPI